MKPRVFIGSSKEGEEVANAIHANLDEETECVVWTQGVFGLSDSNIESLTRKINESEFAVFVFTPDDSLTMRGKLFSAPRDNVVYELGLFSGALGRERCFFVTPRRSTIHLPTDLLGMTAGSYDERRRDNDLQAAVGPFCTKVRNKIKRLWLDIEFSDPKPSQFYVGWQTVTCQCAVRPGREVFLFTEKEDRWWPRLEQLKRSAKKNTYEAKTYFDSPGYQTLHVIKTNDLGTLWIENYRYFAKKHEDYPSIFTQVELPRGFISLASIEVEVFAKPA